MILSRRAALGGVQLDEIDEAIVIRSIRQGTANESLNASERMGGWGQRLSRQHYDTLDVVVSYAIDIPKRKMTQRREVMDAVNTWALKKGWLTINWMTGKRMYVDHVIIPQAQDLWDWTDEYQITFRAYNVPFWQDSTANKVTSKTNKSGSLTLTVNGNVESPLDLTFENKSGQKIDKFSVTSGGQTIALTSLGLGGSSTLKISHGTNGLLKITADGSSVYNKYSGDDDILLKPGENTINFSASRAGILTATNNGRWI